MTFEPNHLSPLEHAVARSVARGESASAGAARLQLREPQYRAVVHRIQQKTGVATHHELVQLLTRTDQH